MKVWGHRRIFGARGSGLSWGRVGGSRSQRELRVLFIFNRIWDLCVLAWGDLELELSKRQRIFIFVEIPMIRWCCRWLHCSEEGFPWELRAGQLQGIQSRISPLMSALLPVLSSPNVPGHSQLGKNPFWGMWGQPPIISLCVSAFQTNPRGILTQNLCLHWLMSPQEPLCAISLPGNHHFWGPFTALRSLKTPYKNSANTE